MSSEQTSSVPDFIDADGVAYTNIEVIVEIDSDIRSTAKMAQALERPIGERGRK